MMISPSIYIEEHKNDTFEQLLKEKENLIEELRQLEKLVFF